MISLLYRTKKLKFDRIRIWVLFSRVGSGFGLFLEVSRAFFRLLTLKMVAYVNIEYSAYQFSEESKGGGVESIPPSLPRSLRYRKKRGPGRVNGVENICICVFFVGFMSMCINCMLYKYCISIVQGKYAYTKRVK